RGDQSVWKDPATGYLRRAICPPGAGRIEVTEVTLPAGARGAFSKETFPVLEQQIWMLRGTLHLAGGAILHVLRGGDHLTLGPPGNCTFENREKSACVYVVLLVRTASADIR